ncbi:hypothetical protein AB0B66_09210 [Catellatospora sp. NPDC049111]|uniref:hypothetical protein n=1 Tax=Catellatospora sp. NPDC049111 TaxID=3155271 RepID=UPI0033E8CE94
MADRRTVQPAATQITTAVNRGLTSLGLPAGDATFRFVADRIPRVGAGTVKKYASGERCPSMEWVRDFAALAGVPVTMLYLDLGWLSAGDVLGSEPESVARQLQAMAVTLSRLEPQVREVTAQASMNARAPMLAADAVLRHPEGGTRFTVELSTVQAAGPLPMVTHVVAEFRLRAGMRPLPADDLRRLAESEGMQWRPQEHARRQDEDYWAVNLELRALVHSVLRDAGQHTWQGEPGTTLWRPAAAHLLVQDVVGGVPRPAGAAPWQSAQERPILVIGNLYSASVTAGLLAETLGWEFVPVRAGTEITPLGTSINVGRDVISGRFLAWRAVAAHIAERQAALQPWPAVILIKPSVLRGRDGIDEYPCGLLAQTPARILYPEPGPALRAWWARRQTASSLPQDFDARSWLAEAEAEHEVIARTLAARGRDGLDLTLALPAAPDGALSLDGPQLPSWLVALQVRSAWQALRWLDDNANWASPSLVTTRGDGRLGRWARALGFDTGREPIPFPVVR